MIPTVFQGPGFRPTALELEPGLSFERWLEIGELLAGIHRATPWWIGAWWNEGERRYGDRAHAAALFGLKPETVSNYAAVEKAIPEKSRRSDVSFSTHAIVASLPARERDRWLKRCSEESLAGRDLRQLLNAAGAIESGPQPQWSNPAATVSPREALKEALRVPELESVVRPALAALDANPPPHRCPKCEFEF